jgi:hypothetical protein
LLESELDRVHADRAREDAAKVAQQMRADGVDVPAGASIRAMHAAYVKAVLPTVNLDGRSTEALAALYEGARVHRGSQRQDALRSGPRRQAAKRDLPGTIDRVNGALHRMTASGWNGPRTNKEG